MENYNAIRDLRFHFRVYIFVLIKSPTGLNFHINVQAVIIFSLHTSLLNVKDGWLSGVIETVLFI